MKARRRFEGASAMASRWRRRRMCVLICDAPAPAGLRDISATGAFLETNARPAVGSHIELHHPEAGAIAGIVQAIAGDGIAVSFVCSEHSVAFALGAITSDMSRPAV
jgi:hypothetical protein